MASPGAGEEGWGREDLISCCQQGSVSVVSTGSQRGHFQDPQLREGPVGSSCWFLYRCSDDRSDSRALEGVT